jgi:MraZ protein
MPFFGEYECKVDAKGRLRLPTPLIRQMDGQGVYTFVISRGFDKCLMLYEKPVWDKMVEDMEKLSVYNRKERQFMRSFFGGASIIQLDSADRVLLSKRQMDFAGIAKDVILTPLKDRIEIWSPEEYDAMMSDQPDSLSDLAEEVMFSPSGSQSTDE